MADLCFLVIGGYPFVIVADEVAEGLSGLNQLSGFQRAASHVSVEGSGDDCIRQVELRHLQVGFFAQDGRLHTAAFLARLRILRLGGTLLAEQGFVTGFHGFVFSLDLFVLLLRDGLFGQEVGITSMVLFELPEAGFRLGDIGLLYADIHLGGFDAGT